MTTLRPNVLAAKDRLTAAHQEFQRRHEAGATGVELCAAMTDLRDRIVLELTEAALDDLHESGPRGLLSEIALVAHGGYGRRDVAPFSDVDLMILHPPGRDDRVASLAERLLRDVFDAGLCLGHSVRTPEQACRLAANEPMICTSLVESRLLRGDAALFARYQKQFRRQKRRRARGLISGVLEDRWKEQRRYGETVFLLEPNVKRSRGALRDFQLIRWIGSLRYGAADPRELHARGLLSEEDFRALERAYEFLLRLRNELHFHARQAADVLDRAEQLRIAELRGYKPQSGLLPVEQFMRDYFRHTAALNHIATQFAAKAQSRDAWIRTATLLFGHRVDDGVHVGPAGVLATRRAAERISGDLTSIMQLVDLANLYDTSIAPATWEVIRRRACRLPKAMPPPQACRYFLSLLAHPAKLGPLLRDLHDAHLLERFVPEFHHARGLLQFNQYHKYTVDEHCLRAVEFATDLWNDAGPLGRVYRPMPRKYLLHLALLIHDLGKGRLEDHREVGVQIATAVAQRLGLPDDEAESLRFLVHKHMLMNHLAFRRDTSDEQLVVQLAVQVGSPELLQMLYVLTACDLGAVGPNVWDGWKQEVVTDLYHRTMQHLAGESPETTIDELPGRRREAVRQELGASQNDPWFVEHVDALPAAYFNVTSSAQAAADLRLLHGLTLLPMDRSQGKTIGGVSVAAAYQPDTATVQLTVATSESIIQGIFHRLTGALSSRGLKIRAAEIHTLPDGLVLDRFVVHDPDFAGEPPPSRLEQIGHALAQSLQADANRPPAFRRTWQMNSRPAAPMPGVPTRVNIDNSTSAQFTIIDVFTHDRTGLLYAVARELFELELSVSRAKIGTYLDQVVDVFYVTDRQDCKIRDERRLEEIRRRLLEVAERKPDAT
ncbi:MAG: [protein-PII] uridylyltransferase [Thermoguttaceae bacterium]